MLFCMAHGHGIWVRKLRQIKRKKHMEKMTRNSSSLWLHERIEGVSIRISHLRHIVVVGVPGQSWLKDQGNVITELGTVTGT